jgi:hypothetical protein
MQVGVNDDDPSSKKKNPIGSESERCADKAALQPMRTGLRNMLRHLLSAGELLN